MKPPFAELANLAWSQFWQVTVAALAVGVLVWLFCRKRPHLAYMLWLLVILKCLTPPIVSSPTGVFSWAQVRATTPPARDAPEDAAASTPLSADVAISQQPPPFPEPEPLAPEAFTERKTVTGNVPPPKTPERRVQAAVVLGVVWLLGSVVYAGVVIGLRVRWSLLLRNTSAGADGALGCLAADLSKRLGVRRQVRLLVTSKPLGPVAYGVLRPTVLLPELLLAEKSPQQIEAVLAHELTHVRRRDNLVGILQLLAQAIWWFHPLIWWANRQICRQRERCCDEEVVARLGCEPGQYAQSLLDVLKLKHKLRPVFAFPGVRPGEITSKRMEEIMEPARTFHRRTPRWCWLVILAAATLILPGRALVIARGAEPPKPDEKAAEARGSDEKEVASATTKQRPGLTVRRVATDCSTHAVISPDGKYLCDVVFDRERRTNDLLIRELATGEERRIKSEAFGNVTPLWPTISPNSKSIAFASYDSKKEAYEAHLIGMDGSGDRVLCGDLWPAVWSPDGKRLLAWFGRQDPSTQEIVSYSIADGSLKVVKTLPRHWWGRASMELSPDGRYATCTHPHEQGSSKHDITVVALEDGSDIPLVKNPADDRLLCWTRDGNYIVFASDRSGTWDAWLLRVVDGKRHGWPQLAKRHIGDIRAVEDYPPTGSCYYLTQYEMRDVYVGAVDLETGKVISGPEPFRHTSISSSPAWSPDGRYLAYCTWHADGSARVHIHSLATGDERELEPNLPHFYWLTWSPDGRSLLASNFRARGEFTGRQRMAWYRSAYRIDAETGQSKLLWENDRGRVARAEFSPDGNALFYRKGDSLMTRDLETGQEKEILEFPGLTQGKVFVNWDLSPDGKRFAIAERSPETDVRLRTVSATGGEPKELFHKSGKAIPAVEWAPDGQGVLFLMLMSKKGPEGTELWHISAEGGEPRKLLDLGPGWWGPLRVHPDGKRIALSRATSKSELWAMENFLPLADRSAEPE